MDNPINEPEKELTREEPIAVVEQPWSREAVIAVESKDNEPPSPDAVASDCLKEEIGSKAEPVTDVPIVKEEPIKTEPVASSSLPKEDALDQQVSEPVSSPNIFSKPPLHNQENINIHKYRYDAPYPSTKGVGKNLTYAKIIQESFASPVSEYTAASQYVFDHLVSENQSKEVSEAFEGIAIVEMQHLEMLGELILELGALPFYKGDWRNKFWQGNFVKYNTNLRTMILCAISDEKKAISQYEKSIKMIREPKIDKLLQRIILDEEVHIEIFKELLRKL